MSVRVLPPPAPESAGSKLNLLVPFSVTDLLKLLAVSGGAGRIKFGEARVSFSVLAHTRAGVFFPGSTTSVDSPLGPLELTSDFYDAAITVLFAWPQNAIIPIFSGPLTHPVRVLPELMFASLQQGFALTVDNETTVDAMITFDYNWFSADKSLWQDTVVPLLDAVYRMLKDEVTGYLKAHGASVS